VIRKEIRSFGHAFRGLKFLFQSQKHFRFHVLAGIGVSSIGLATGFTVLEWAIVLLCIGAVMMAEALNSALEVLMDKLHPEQDPMIGKAKDMAAAGVLIVAMISLVIALIVIVPHLIMYCG